MDDPHALAARYFDGELDGEEAEAALDHLTVCARCQAELGDLIGVEVALSRTGPATPAASPRPLSSGQQPALPPPPVPIEAARRARSRRWVPAAIVGALAAAALLVLALRRDDRVARPTELALAETRGAEVRFTAAPFDRHRPYAVARSTRAGETFALDALAALEKRGDLAALAAAQASSGELARARAVLDTAPASAARDADRAAIELLDGKPEVALEAAERALAASPTLAAARWNRALALRALGLPLAAAAALDGIVASRGPGWADEAAGKAAAWRAELAERGPRAQAYAAAARAMVDRTGPPLTAADVDARPGLTRLHFHDALRGATSPAEAQALRPLAEALDRQAGNELAARAIDEVAAGDFGIRAPLALTYRDLAAGRDPDRGASLLDRLGHVRAPVDDLRLGTIVLAGQATARLPELTQLVAATGDPWFELMLARERGRALLAAGQGDRAEAVLRDGLARCDGRRWAHRCAHLAMELVTLYGSATRYAETEAHAAIAVRMFRASGATELEDQVLSVLAEAERGRGRFALAAATFEEVRARVADRDCATARYATSGLALIASYQGAATLAVAPPPPDACGLPPDPLEVAAMVDLARMTERDGDRARAAQWIAAARATGDAALAVVADLAEARLDVARDPAAAGRVRDALARLTATDDLTVALRALAYQTLVEDAGRRGAWTDAVATAAAELGVAAPARCALVVSVDDTRGTAVALGADGSASGATSRVAAPGAWDGATLVPASLAAALAGCPRIAVLARPPLHGRADLLPPSAPWAFVGRAAPHPAPAAAPREVIVGDALPPAALALPALAPVRAVPGATVVRGAAATPAAVLAALAGATYAELHVHGQVDLGVADASFLALSPGADERWALTAAEVRTARLTAAPVVVLAACRAAAAAPFQHRRWSLPDAFLEAGARAVIAPTVEVPDAEAAAFFDALRTRLAAGDEPAAALAALRAEHLARGATWAGAVILFE